MAADCAKDVIYVLYGDNTNVVFFLIEHCNDLQFVIACNTKYIVDVRFIMHGAFFPDELEFSQGFFDVVGFQDDLFGDEAHQFFLRRSREGDYNGIPPSTQLPCGHRRSPSVEGSCDL
ncbi:MAG: hypothetical protein WDO15_13225 [Bacteroidota bacterium]